MADNIAFNREYERLNPEQKMAVDTIYWPVMVVAGPWTGKTQIIWMRTANILLNTDTNPENILITTFTDAWVIAIKERLQRFIWNEAYKVNVVTIHWFCEDVIKTFPEKFSYYKASTPIDEVEWLELLKWLLWELIEKNKIEHLKTDMDDFYYLRTIYSRISTLKREWISDIKLKLATKKQAEIYTEELSEIKPTLKKYELTRKKQEKHIWKLKELQLIFKEYNALLRQKEYYDFNDMINFVLEQFGKDEDLKYYYAEKFQFIMLDEYQDTNNAQNEIVEAILSLSVDENPNILVVWDDDQSIYRFQGANIENMLSFTTKYPNPEIIVLDKNYRSNQEILDLSKSVIENNLERISSWNSQINKVLTAKNKTLENIKPKLIRASSPIEEKTFVIEKVKKLLKSDKINPEDIAIICRSNKEVEDWTNFFAQNDFIVNSKKKTNILNNNYVEFLINFLEIIKEPFIDSEKLVNLLLTESIDFDNIDVLKINNYIYKKSFKDQKISFFEVISNESFLDEIDWLNREKIKIFLEKISNFNKLLNENTFVDYVRKVFLGLGLWNHIEKEWTFEDLLDMFTLLNKIQKYNNLDRDFNTEKFLRKINLFREYNIAINRENIKKEISWINIMTSHSSKGLEFKTVFLVWVITSTWESKRNIDTLKLPKTLSSDNLASLEENKEEEERRLFFVAVTRAETRLYLSFSKQDEGKLLLPSSFINEALENTDEIIFEPESLYEIIENASENKLIKPTQSEFDYIENFFENYKLSASHLNSFLNDPKDFLIKYVYRVPFEVNNAMIFWRVYHKALELFFIDYKNNKKLPSKESLILTFERLLSKELLTQKDEETLLEKWRTWLAWYYDRANFTAREIFALEHDFWVKNIMFDNEIPITWKVDKIEFIWEDKNNVALVDYKTWKTKSINEIKWFVGRKDAGYFRQLLFYKILFELDNEVNKYKIWELALDFIEWKDDKYKYVSVEYSEEELEELKQTIKEVYNQMTDINFWKQLLNNDK